MNVNNLIAGENMNYKKLLLSSVIAAGVLFVSSQTFATELQAGVAKSETNKAQVQQQAAKRKYAEIEKLIEYNHYKEAESKLEYILERNQKDIDALALRAVSWAKQHKLEPAQKEIDKLIKDNPNNPILHYAQGIVYMNRQTSSDVDYIKSIRNLNNSAIKEFVTAVNLDNTYYAAYNAMGVATLKLGNKTDAKDLFTIATDINPQYATAYDNLGVLEMMNNNLDGAEEYFQKALKYNTTNPTSMYHMGQVEARRGNYSKALTWINHSVHINPNSAPALNLQGELYLKQGNQPAALNSFNKAVLVKPEHSASYLNLANVYEKRVDNELAIEKLKTLIAINPNYQEGKLRIADMSLIERKYEQALDYYSQLVGDDTYNQEAIIGLANTYYEMSKDHADSFEMTTNKELYIAYEYINKAIEQTPDDLKLHLAKLKLSQLVHMQEMPKESLDYIIKSAGNNMMDSVIKGEAYLTMGRESDAVYTFENAINFAQNVDDCLYLGEILVHHKQFRTARTALKKALMKDPDNIIAKNGIGYIDLCELKSNEFFDVAKRQFKEKNYASTIEYCNRAIDFYHNNAEIAKLKAMAYEEEPNYQGAVKYYTQYLAFNPNAADKAAVTKKIEKYKRKAVKQNTRK